MKHSTISAFAKWLGIAVALGCAWAPAGCSSNRGENASQMTSFSSKESKAATPELFTIPQNQMCCNVTDAVSVRILDVDTEYVLLSAPSKN